MTTFRRFCILLTTELVPKIFPNLNVVDHLVNSYTCGLGFLPAEAGYFSDLFFMVRCMHYEELES